jgi:hypothetical protein
MSTMGWVKTKGNRREYHRYVREGPKVLRIRLGAGPVAQAAADLDAWRREERESAREARRVEQARQGQADALVVAFHHLATRMTDALMSSAGYHRHDRGAWRKRRPTTMTRTITTELDPMFNGSSLSDDPNPDERQPVVPGIDDPRVGDLGDAAETAWLDLASNGDRPTRDALATRLHDLKAELAGNGAPAVVWLMARRVALAWLVAGYDAAAVASALSATTTPAQLLRLERRRDRSQRDFLAASKTLATIQKLFPPHIPLPSRTEAEAKPQCNPRPEDRTRIDTSGDPKASTRTEVPSDRSRSKPCPRPGR